MATAVFFHAHPDDEAIATGGTMAKASAAGHRVVLVTATKGEHGEVAEGFLEPGEALWERRVREVAAAADILGVHRNEFLGYVDSGMMDTPENKAAESFWQADIDEAGERLAKILREENADVLVIYDPNGNYGHPDHIQVHRVGNKAAELAGTRKVYEVTFDRTYFQSLIQRMREAGIEPPGDDAPDPNQDIEIGMPAELITTTVDVHDYIDTKRKAMAAHASQISETSFFLSMPLEMFDAAWGQEWYILHGAAEGTKEDDLFAGISS